MKLKHIKLLRKILVVVFLVFVISVVYSYYKRSGKQVQKINSEKILTSDVARATEKIEFTENRDGRELFNVNALKHVEKIKGKNILEQVRALNHSKDGSRRDTIQSDHCEYDPSRNDVIFNGHVIVKVNEGLEILTDSLTYDKLTERASTSERFSMKDKGIDGSGKGLHYNFSTKDFEIDQEVNFFIKSTSAVGQTPTKIQANSGSYSQSQRLLKLLGSVQITQGNTSLKGNVVHIYLSADDKIDHIQASEQAYYAMVNADRSTELKGDSIKVDFSRETNGIERLHASGNSTFSVKDRAGEDKLVAEQIVLKFSENQPLTMEATTHVVLTSLVNENKFEILGEQLLASFRKEGGAVLENLTIQTNAKLRSLEGEPNRNDLSANRIALSFADEKGGLKELGASGNVVWLFATESSSKSEASLSTRTLKCQHMKTSYQADGRNPRQLWAQEKCYLEIPPDMKSERNERKIINGNQFDATFHPGTSQIDKFFAEENVKVTFEPTDKSVSPSMTRSHKLKLEFDPSGEGKAFEQAGNFQYDDGKKKATSDRAVREEPNGLIHLIGHPTLWDEGTKTVSESATIDKEKKLFIAKGDVRSIHKGGGTPVATPFTSDSQEPILIKADTLEADDNEGTAKYRGNPRASQEGNFVQAEEIDLLNKSQQFRAYKNVYSVFYVKDDVPAAAQKAPSPATLRSQRMTYYQKTNTAHYEHAASILFNGTFISSDSMDLFLDDREHKIEKAYFDEKVYFKQPDREGTGTHAEYYANEDKTVLMGELAQIDSPTKGKSAGKRLTFYNNGDRIFIDSR